MTFLPYPGDAPIGFAASPVDRLAERRSDPQWQAAQQQSAAARYVLMWRYRVPLDNAQAAIVAPEAVPDVPMEPIFLGWADEQPWFALDVSSLDEDAANGAIAPARFQDLRFSSPKLEAGEAAILAYARAMVYWQRQHRHCGRCGGPTEATHAGHVLRCAACEVEHYPRSDPSMLVLVTSGERALLGRQAIWPPGVWSTLAGFAEPGESLEDAVLREVWEEARIRVTSLRYYGSQPWPFPASVLMGYHAQAEAQTPQTDQDELEAADWFDRATIARGLQERSIHLPPPVTLSYRLIEHWFDAGWETPLRSMMKPFAPRS